ncbi:MULTISPECIES: enoyl-CoA hydratase/isomerase family protein [unclassified Microbacterium]|uniref:enoyl-CoA hydratase/isomerase family protein n=1 Tax=unclassified Microbacterium TaxID=2609290 RepID=UPI000CFC4BDA|nr:MULTISPECIES: enoyl-CoA hydratase/isomerase family protein [unclassified Microbacterium]PQZ56843.1 enoyl-CoA hydratase [Microbacterium sp. MYb43]PQZ79798.1 enoyl-CoA hydratase [Microbacterium sp. MYb40]PRB20100.1 enoyl-CoA hydratase [Microbacterium sp. MYb54]PRB27384.1 enoyl-CoA hydratase [Microbacterium sp. MYb50]PRB67279.1 enoyl-CoA hydratase [Microbacterium sp. MYb24]
MSERLLGDEPLLIERHDDRVVATLNRPHKRNAIDQATIDALHVLCAELEAIPRPLILTGADGVFAAGADIAELRERRAADALRGINAHAFIRLAELPMPVIAAIDGYALGGGAELAYSADIRIATPTLAIGNPETGLGILAAAGAGWRLKEIIGDARAIELLLTGRTVKADEALRIGLVSAIHDVAELLPAAHAIVDRIARNDRAATIATKRVFRAPRDRHPAVDLEAQAELFESPEKFRRMTDFLERRDR